MTLNSLPLSYCTNVHPGLTVAEILQKLDEFTLPIQQQLGTPLAAGLWLAQPVIEEILAEPEGIDGFAAELQQRNLTCYTLNAFPYGNFHSERVKENVYLPDWTKPERLEYTKGCARVLAALLPEGTEGSISTVPLGFKGFEHAPDFGEKCIDQLIELAVFLKQLQDETGRTIRLAVEPEPFCVIEFTHELIVYFERLYERAAKRQLLGVVREFIGACYDVCHQAVEFEDIPGSIRQITHAEIRINKIHISNAIELVDPWENEAGRTLLAEYAEPRYLHQTIGSLKNGDLYRQPDLTREFLLDPHPRLQETERLRVHFHVPVDAQSLGPLGTTHRELRQALATVKELDYAPHLEVETYTWEVLPGDQKPSLVDGLTRELQAARKLIDTL
ncbi:Xylose isomerase-like TIM barrel [Gimesia panareensis]|uniref:Xylose isomerase-like TIM barrel n=1 Tax=Gimesia panareensis TaxID=2527978 RepID=A0A517QG96_9PLAN|nr:metabolite traffic protein EboE [Gimesia panareensis]QDT30662.1 Xylose isomerase-like TIM barrel [Gimesia panareensis]